MPTTLLTYATNERDTYQQAVTLAQQDLTTAQASLAKWKALLADDTDLLKSVETDIAKKRNDLAQATVPSEAAALVAEIQALDERDHALQWQVLQDREGVDTAQAKLDFATARLKRATAEAQQASQFLDAVSTDTNRRAQWHAAILGPPLSTLPAQAGAALGDTNFNNATAKLANTIIPDKLMEIATSRRSLWRTRLTSSSGAVDSAQTLLGSQAQTDQNLEGLVVQKQIDFAHAERAFGAWVATAKERFDSAVNALTNLAKGDPILTSAQIHDVFLAASLAARTAAEGNEKGLNDAKATADTKRRTWEDAVLQARASNPNATDAAIAADVGVTAAKGPLDTANHARDLAQETFAAADRSTIADWQEILPPTAWQKIYSYIDAVAALNDLQGANPANLAASMDTAEGAYGDALGNKSKSDRTIAYYGDSIALRQALSDAAQARYAARISSAVRGDANDPLPLEREYDLKALPINGVLESALSFPFKGRISAIRALVTVPGQGGGATQTLTTSIGGVALTGGVLTVALAAATQDAVINATAITGNNEFIANQLISIATSASTAFTDGHIQLFIFVDRFDD